MWTALPDVVNEQCCNFLQPTKFNFGNFVTLSRYTCDFDLSNQASCISLRTHFNKKAVEGLDCTEISIKKKKKPLNNCVSLLHPNGHQHQSRQ